MPWPSGGCASTIRIMTPAGTILAFLEQAQQRDIDYENN
jgi:hypothetical protein